MEIRRRFWLTEGSKRPIGFDYIDFQYVNYQVFI